MPHEKRIKGETPADLEGSRRFSFKSGRLRLPPALGGAESAVGSGSAVKTLD